MTAEQRNEDLSNDPRQHRIRALEAQAKGRKMIERRIASGKWEWVQVDQRTRVLRRKKDK